MACGACPGKKSEPKSYTHTADDGTVRVVSTETEARALKARKGGDYVPDK